MYTTTATRLTYNTGYLKENATYKRMKPNRKKIYKCQIIKNVDL